MTPAEAKKPSNEADANIAMEMVAIKGRRFPVLQIDDIVRILTKKKTVGNKEFMKQFKRGEHTIESISETLDRSSFCSAT
jgi:hypothetical protein